MKLDTVQSILQQAGKLPEKSLWIQGVGIAGSFARGTTDPFSDVDICVFGHGEYPPLEERLALYTDLGFTNVIYKDVNFATSRGDGFERDDLRIDFNWMRTETIQTFLEKLNTDFDSSEWPPGGIAQVKPIHDPENIIAQLQNRIPEYPIERAKYRVEKGLQAAYFSIYDLGWLGKAAHREDFFSFLKYQSQVLEKFFYILYALNRTWLSDEKKLLEQIMTFEFKPPNTEQRIKNIILHQDGNEDLNHCVVEINTLFQDTARCAQQQFHNVAIPIHWRPS